MANDNFILTPEGREKLEEELHYLETEKRAEIGERIKVAREFGDISENSEYDDAKNEQGMVETRIAEISRILSEATVVDAPEALDQGQHRLYGHGRYGRQRARVHHRRRRREQRAEGKISNESPVGAALIGHKKGDHVRATVPPAAKIEMDILKIER